MAMTAECRTERPRHRRPEAAVRARASPLFAPARDHVGLVEEPQPAVLLQDLARWLRDSGRRRRLPRPGGPRPAPHRSRHSRRRTASRCRSRIRGDLARQRVHVVAEQRAVVGIGVEVEIAAGGSELLLHRLHDLMAIVDERIVARPDLLHDLVAGIVAVRMDGDQPAARSERLASGAITRLALKSSEARARYGCEAMTRS